MGLIRGDLQVVCFVFAPLLHPEGKRRHQHLLHRLFKRGWHTLFRNGFLQLCPHEIHTEQPSVLLPWPHKTTTTAKRSLCPPRLNSPNPRNLPSSPVAPSTHD
jgi:hypothetical protein